MSAPVTALHVADRRTWREALAYVLTTTWLPNDHLWIQARVTSAGRRVWGIFEGVRS